MLRLETSPSGREVTGVVAVRDGQPETYAADIVVVCAGAANTAAILLRSASDAHPDGLANGSGQVGRNYMFHNSRAVLALSKEPNDTVYQKTLGINDFYLPGDGRDWPLGNIQMLGKSNAEAMKGEEPKLTKLAPKLALAQVARHGVDFWLTTEDLPRPGNRVTVDREGRSTWLTRRATRPRPRACTASCARCSSTPGWRLITCSTRACSPAWACRWPGSRTRRDLPVRHRPGHLGAGCHDARPTRWTTCTSPTPASCRASAR